ncbi:MAG: stage V sporulation protein SpoVM [Symbiobacteriia bacterium]
MKGAQPVRIYVVKPPKFIGSILKMLFGAFSKSA